MENKFRVKYLRKILMLKYDVIFYSVCHIKIIFVFFFLIPIVFIENRLEIKFDESQITIHVKKII